MEKSLTPSHIAGLTRATIFGERSELFLIVRLPNLCLNTTSHGRQISALRTLEIVWHMLALRLVRESASEGYQTGIEIFQLAGRDEKG